MGSRPTAIDTDELRRRVASIDWYHSIDLGNGVVTPGMSRNDLLAGEELPAFEGRSVLDIGAWDGYYSFLAERSGASRVVAFDEYVWCIDIPARDRYWKEREEAGVMPDPERDADFFDRRGLPGRRGFDLAKEALGSAVEPVVGDLHTYDLASLGAFDVVLYLGVLYHVQEPLTALRRLRAVTREVAVIETEAIVVRDHEDEPLAMFWAGGELNARLRQLVLAVRSRLARHVPRRGLLASRDEAHADRPPAAAVAAAAVGATAGPAQLRRRRSCPAGHRALPDRRSCRRVGNVGACP